MKRSYNTGKYLPIRISFCLIFLLFESCNLSEELTPVAGAKEWFNKTYGSQWAAFPKKSKIQSIDWSNAITNGRTIEVPVYLETKVTGQYYNGKKSTKNEISMRLVIWEKDKYYQAIVIEMFQQGGNLPRHLGEMEESGFTGLVIASNGSGTQYATLFDKGQSQQKKQQTATGRTEDVHCIYYIHYTTISYAGYSATTTHSTFQGCYSDTEPQIPLPDEASGTYYWDYNTSQGGASGNWSSDPPASPQHGDTFETTDFNTGKTTISRYNAHTQTWEWFEIILPAVEVTAHPDQYPHLYNVPTDITIIGPDNLVYSFDINILSWRIKPVVENELTTPCLYDKIENIRNAEIESKVRDIFDKAFDNNSTPYSYIFKETPTLSKPAQTAVTDEFPLQVTTTLNTSVLSSASNEYITLAVFHEIIHGVLYYQGTQDELHHTQVLSDYIDEIIKVGQSFYPDMALKDIQALALLGLTDISTSNAFISKMNSFNLTMPQISEIGLSYRRDNVSGNVKKGTPCN